MCRPAEIGLGDFGCLPCTQLLLAVKGRAKRKAKKFPVRRLENFLRPLTANCCCVTAPASQAGAPYSPVPIAPSVTHSTARCWVSWLLPVLHFLLEIMKIPLDIHPLKKRGNTAKFLLTRGGFFVIMYGHAAERTSSPPRDRDEPGDCSKEVTSGEYVR